MTRFVAVLVFISLLICVPMHAKAQDPVEGMIAELGLSPVQVGQIRNLFEAFAKKQEALPTAGDALLQNREAIRGVVTAAPFDLMKAQQVVQKVTSTVEQRMVNRLELRNQIFHVLTPQQQEKYIKMVQEALDKMM
jgi:Spy/CpxP family protein refolding chaperone